MRSILATLFIVASITAAVAQEPTDCPAIKAEIAANNARLQELASAPKITAGVAWIVVIPIVWFGHDPLGAVAKETAALRSRQQYLSSLAEERCAPAQAEEKTRRRRAARG